MTTVADYEWTKEDAAILKAVFDGGGDAAMQRRVIVHIVEMLCGVNQVGFDPDNMNVTAFHAGRKWVARQIQNAITIPHNKLIKEPTNEPDRRVLTATERLANESIERARRGG